MAPLSMPAAPTALFSLTTTIPPEPCALRMFRHQSDFLSAPQSVSRVFLETDWGAIFQCKFSPRNMRNTHGSGGNIAVHDLSQAGLDSLGVHGTPGTVQLYGVLVIRRNE